MRCVYCSDLPKFNNDGKKSGHSSKNKIKNNNIFIINTFR